MLLLALAGILTSCKPSTAKALPDPDPMQVLQAQLGSERQLRQTAEHKADEEAEIRDRWKLGAMGLGALVVVGFIAGTAIGSTGRRHASGH